MLNCKKVNSGFSGKENQNIQHWLQYIIFIDTIIFSSQIVVCPRYFLDIVLELFALQVPNEENCTEWIKVNKIAYII